MKHFCAKCAYILIFQFVFVVAAFANTLTVDEAGNVLAETDRYVARFENGVLMHFHNKLTNETYTQGEFEAHTRLTRLVVEGRALRVHEITPEIKRLSPLECQLIYQDSWSAPRDNDMMFYLFIGIDAETGDLLIRQKGVSKVGGIEHIIWGFSNLSHAAVEVILPTRGGRMISNDRNFSDTYYYPGSKWEAQLAILQGQLGGVFVRSDDTQYQFKTLEYVSEGGSFTVSLGQHPPVPYDQHKQATTATWRLNAYQGDWQVPALHYRRWMHEAFQPPDRREMPAWVNDIELVIGFPFYPVDMEAGILGKLSQLVDPEKTLLYVTDWRESGWALNYPDYTPVTSFANFGHFVKEAHRYGFRVMPHVNVVAVSLSNPLYAEFEKYQMYDPRTGEKIGSRLSDEFPLHRRYAWINPASGEFRKLLVDRVKSVWETYRVDAFHLDISHFMVNNPPIDGLTVPEGSILLHQELREAMPGVVLGGEGLHEVTFLYESLARLPNSPKEHPHAISSFLFSPYVLRYGHLGVPHPNRQQPGKSEENQEKYKTWNARLLIMLVGISDLDPDLEIHRLLQLVGERQNYRFGDVNGDGVVNILDLTLVAQQIGTPNPSNRRVDVNKDGVVNILDLVLVANAF